MESSSESSSTVCPPRIFADLLFLENVTVGPVAGALGFAVVPAAATAGLVAPKSSDFTWSGGTPNSVKRALVASIIGAGPQMWNLREARSGTVCVSNSLVSRPRGPCQSVPSAFVLVTATRSFGLRC